MNLRPGLPDARLLGCCCRHLATTPPQPARVNVEGERPKAVHYTTVLSIRCPLHGGELATAVEVNLNNQRTRG